MKKCMGIIFAIFMLAFCGLSVSALEGSELMSEEEWESFEQALPEEIRDEFFDSGIEGSEGYADAVTEKSGVKYIFSRLLEAISLEWGSVARLFLAICALLILSAVFNTASSSFSNDSLASAVRFCSAGAIFAVIVYTQYEHFAQIEKFFDSLGALMRAMIPMTASIWAMGGNVSTASVGSASFFVMLSVCEELLRNSIVPICCVMSVLGLCDAMSDEMKTGRLLAAIKKIYAFFLGIIMTLLLSSLSAQTSIAAAADTTAARTARLLSGTMIPVVGGSVGETLRTVYGGVVYLKNIFGIGGIMMISGLLLPVGISVLLTRLVFLICGGLAEVLGCANEARFLGNLGEIYGTMLAVISGVSVMFILALCIFMQTVVAVM